MIINVVAIVEILNSLSPVILLVTAIIATVQIRETRCATYASAFKSIYDLLQADEIITARGYVFSNLNQKPFNIWTDDDKKIAEKVCSSYDSAGIMVKNRMIPVNVVADSWGDSLRQSWRILSPLVIAYRVQRNANEYWDDFEWLARQAETYQRTIHS